ncbi:hydrogenase iron-sulfur subunit [Anaerolineales bacterium HSG25]|nr:hydrogenase iron-sulfur subunit [Anaerolineales bacterium HSG25]
MNDKSSPTKEKKPDKGPKPSQVMTWRKLPDTSPAETMSPVDWETRNHGGRPFLRWLERLALVIERPINRLVGVVDLNPFYHTGTIAFFLLMVVFGTGVYLLMFYQYGATVSYESVAHMENFFVSRIARAVHRYASGGLVIFTLLHAFRIFFQGRFQGARWLGWVGGIVATAMIWLAGITGYWLIWDQGAQLISQAFLNLLSPFPNLALAFYNGFLAPSAADNIWMLMFILVILHIGLSVLAAVAYWYHIKHLSRPKFFPPQHWVIIMGVSLIVMSLLFPSGLLPIADFTQIPDQIYIDLIYLFYLPTALTNSPFVLWGGVIVLFSTWLFSTIIPWLFPTKLLPPIEVVAEKCVGCTFCAEDCPYDVFTMEPREDDLPYQLVAVAQPELCTSCGICLGSCSTLAISIGDIPPEALWHEAQRRLVTADQKAVKIVFACERHAAQTDLIYQPDKTHHHVPGETSQVETIPVLCAGMVHPDLTARVLDAGAAEVEVIGCPADDCANREGSLWLAERFTRKRSPKLKRSLTKAPIHGALLPPDEYDQIIPLLAKASTAEERKPITRLSAKFTRKNLAYLAVLLAIGLIIQVVLTYVPYTSQQDIQILLERIGG